MTFTSRPVKAQHDAESVANNAAQIRLFTQYLADKIGKAVNTEQEGFLQTKEQA